MALTLAQIRNNHPKFESLNDDELFSYLSENSYKNIDPAELAKKVGYFTPEQRDRDIFSDTGVALKQGAERIPGTILGVGDIVAGLGGFNRPFNRSAEALGEITGIEPAKWANEAESQYSPDMQQAQANIDAVWADPNSSAADKALAYAKNPRASYKSVVSSIPEMLAGGILSRELQLAGMGARLAVGAGEGIVMAGDQMEGIDKSVSPEKAATASLITGVGGAALGMAGNKMAHYAGLGDVDELLLRDRIRPNLLDLGNSNKPKLGLPARIAGSALVEGPGEEGSQSVIETASKNYAEGKPLTEGMARNVTEGSIAGSFMGGAVSARILDPNTSVDDAINTMTDSLSHTAEQPPSINAGEYEQNFQDAANRYGIPVDFLKAIAQQESGMRQFDAHGKPTSPGTSTAIGMMQIIPRWHPEFDPQKLSGNAEYNINAGAKFISDLMREHDGDLSTVAKRYYGSRDAAANQKYANSVLGKMSGEIPVHQPFSTQPRFKDLPNAEAIVQNRTIPGKSILSPIDDQYRPSGYVPGETSEVWVKPDTEELVRNSVENIDNKPFAHLGGILSNARDKQPLPATDDRSATERGDVTGMPDGSNAATTQSGTNNELQNEPKLASGSANKVDAQLFVPTHHDTFDKEPVMRIGDNKYVNEQQHGAMQRGEQSPYFEFSDDEVTPIESAKNESTNIARQSQAITTKNTIQPTTLPEVKSVQKASKAKAQDQGQTTGITTPGASVTQHSVSKDRLAVESQLHMPIYAQKGDDGLFRPQYKDTKERVYQNDSISFNTPIEVMSFINDERFKTKNSSQDITPTHLQASEPLAGAAPKAEDYVSGGDYQAAKLKWHQENKAALQKKSRYQTGLNALNKRISNAKITADKLLNRPAGIVPPAIHAEAYKNANNRHLVLIAERDALIAKHQLQQKQPIEQAKPASKESKPAPQDNQVGEAAAQGQAKDGVISSLQYGDKLIVVKRNANGKSIDIFVNGGLSSFKIPESKVSIEISKIKRQYDFYGPSNQAANTQSPAPSAEQMDDRTVESGNASENIDKGRPAVSNSGEVTNKTTYERAERFKGVAAGIEAARNTLAGISLGKKFGQTLDDYLAENPAIKKMHDKANAYIAKKTHTSPTHLPERSSSKLDQDQSNGSTLAPELSNKLREAHKVHGRSVTRDKVQTMISRVQGEVDASESGRQHLTPTAINKRMQQLDRLKHDLALFDIPKSQLNKNQASYEELQSLVRNLTDGGGVVIMADGKRSQSTNPDWFINGAFVTLKADGNQYASQPSVAQIKQAVNDYSAGNKLKPLQQSIINSLNDVLDALEKSSNRNYPADFDYEETLLAIDIENKLDQGVITLDDIDDALDEYDDSIPFGVTGNELTAQQLDDFWGLDEQTESEKGTGISQEKALDSYTETELAANEREQKQLDNQTKAAELKAKQKERADKEVDTVADEMFGNIGTDDIFGGNPLTNLGRAEKSQPTQESNSNKQLGTNYLKDRDFLKHMAKQPVHNEDGSVVKDDNVMKYINRIDKQIKAYEAFIKCVRG